MKNKHKNPKRYHIYYEKYMIIVNDYIRYVKVVYTDDIYHEIGKLICESFEAIKNVRYTHPDLTDEEAEAFFNNHDFMKVTNNIWRVI